MRVLQYLCVSACTRVHARVRACTSAGRNLSAAAVFALASVALRRWQASPATESGGYAGRRAVGIGFSGLRGADASAADWRRAAAKELKIARIDLSKKLIAKLQILVS